METNIRKPSDEDVKRYDSHSVGNNDNLFYRSELAQEILSQKPDFLERWTLYIVLMILLLLLAMTWIIKYPDIIQVSARLTAQNAPKEILVRQNGRLIKLFASNHKFLKKNEVIGWIESTASHAEVLSLSGQVDSGISLLNNGNILKASSLFEHAYQDLGEIQSAYQEFVTAKQTYNDYMVNGFFRAKKQDLKEDLISLSEEGQTIRDREDLTKQDIKLAEETFNANKILWEKKVISKEEFRVAQSNYVNKKMSIPQLNASILTNESRNREKLKELNQLDHDMGKQKEIFQQTLQSLKSRIDEWRKNYVLQSPIDGKAYFVIPLQENQYLQAGKLLGYVNPGDTHYYIEANLPQYNFGKIDTGLNVQLRFEAYPYQEVGYVEGKVDYISSIPTDSVFLTNIRLTNGLRTQNHQSILYKDGLKAQAIIITKDMRLLQRFYYSIVKSASFGNK